MSDVGSRLPHHACTCWLPPRCPTRLTPPRGAAPASASASAQPSSAARHSARRVASTSCRRKRWHQWRAGRGRLHVLCRARRQEQEEDVVADAWSEEVSAQTPSAPSVTLTGPPASCSVRPSSRLSTALVPHVQIRYGMRGEQELDGEEDVDIDVMDDVIDARGDVADSRTATAGQAQVSAYSTPAPAAHSAPGGAQVRCDARQTLSPQRLACKSASGIASPSQCKFRRHM